MSKLNHFLKKKKRSRKQREADNLRFSEPDNQWHSEEYEEFLNPELFSHEFQGLSDTDEALIRSAYPDKDEQWIKRELSKRKKRKQEKQLHGKRRSTLRDLGLPENSKGKMLEGHQAIADHVKLTLDQVKKRSGELQEAGILRKEYKGRPPNRRAVTRGYALDLKTYLNKYPKPKKK